MPVSALAEDVDDGAIYISEDSDVIIEPSSGPTDSTQPEQEQTPTEVPTEPETEPATEPTEPETEPTEPVTEPTTEPPTEAPTEAPTEPIPEEVSALQGQIDELPTAEEFDALSAEE